MCASVLIRAWTFRPRSISWRTNSAMKLVISLATRGRARQLIDTITKSVANFALPNTVMMVQVDADDTDTVAALGASALAARVKINVKAREDTIAAKWNRALTEPADLYLV